MRLLPLVLLLAPVLASADVVTEFGLGVKVRQSVLFHPSCDVVDIPAANPVRLERGHLGRATASCGGDNPIFVGWPIAYEKDRGPWRWRVGWFHLSSIGDGGGRIAELLGSGDGRELSFDCVCATATFNWSQRSRR